MGRREKLPFVAIQVPAWCICLRHRKGSHGQKGLHSLRFTLFRLPSVCLKKSPPLICVLRTRWVTEVVFFSAQLYRHFRPCASDGSSQSIAAFSAELILNDAHKDMQTIAPPPSKLSRLMKMSWDIQRRKRYTRS